MEVNTVGEGSFTIFNTHPYYDKIKRLRSIFEVRDEIGAVFRGRMTDDSIDFDNGKAIDLEGLMAFFNDSIIAPYNFPEDFLEDADYITATKSGNVVEFFLNWLIEQHNLQVKEWQRFKLGVVTVSDPNNYIIRSDSDYQHTWDILKSKLFDSALGGYLCIRYEEDGNYIDYLSEFTLTNTQEIEFGKNLLDLKRSTKGSETYTAIIPIGAEIEVATGEVDEEGNTITEKKKLTLEDVQDGNLTDDIVKITLPNGLHAIYSESLVEEYGWICQKPSETTWDDVTDLNNLKTKSIEHLTGTAMMLSETMEISAVDLHFNDAEIRSFRIYRNVNARSLPHGISKTYPLTRLAIPLLEPQNTKITIGETKLTLTDQNNKEQSEMLERVESAKNELKDYVSTVQKGLTQKIEGIDGTYFYIMYSAYADGHVMTNTPNENTLYMGTCNTNKSTAPTNYKEYNWVLIRGKDGQDGQDGVAGEKGKDGQSQYFHVKYSNDGKTFTANNGETLGDWMGTCVNTSATDPTSFSAYTWKKIVGENGENGIDGIDGEDGVSNYFFVKFSDNADGNPMTESPTPTTKYMGVCSTTSPTAPTSYSEYKWTQCKGEDGEKGVAGEKGADGKTQYLHIKYSDDGQTFTENNGEELGAWIGTLTDFIETDSTNFDDYTWKKFTEDVDSDLEDIRTSVVTQSTEMINTCETIIFGALESYVETGNYDEFKETVESQLKILSDQISLNFESTTTAINNVNGDLQKTVEKLEKHFDFSLENGLIIRTGEANEMSLQFDNDIISFKKNGVQFGWWDGVNFHTGNIYVDVEEKAQFGNFAFVPRSDGSLMFLKVGDA